MEYKKLSVIKQSQQSTVWLCEDENGEKAVCKRVRAAPEIYKKLNELKSAYTPLIYEINESPSDKKYIEIFEEYIDGETLQEQQLTYKQAMSAAISLCRAVEEIHSVGIIHRDIKPSNIMLDKNGRLKIVDFSSARFYRQEMDRDTVCLGTHGFAAPEQYGYSQTDFRTDIYAVGQSLRLIFEGSVKFPIGYIIDRCTCFDPDKRFRSCKPIIFLLKTADMAKAITVTAVLVGILLAVSINMGEKALPASADMPEITESTVQTEALTESIKTAEYEYDNEALRLALEAEYAHSSEGYIGSGLSEDWLFQYDEYSDHIVITKYSGDEEAVVIPEEINGLPVTEIASLSFSSHKIRSVSIPDSVIMLESSAFLGCSSLESVTLGAGVEYIGESAFINCVKLETVNMGDKVRYIGDSCFAGDAMLKMIKMPDTVEYLGESAFMLCNLHFFNIPAGVTVIKPYTFNGKPYSEEDGAYETYLPPNITESTEIRELTIPSTVRKIEHDAFSGIRSLEKVTVSEGVEAVSASAFHSCPMEDNVWVNEKKVERDCIFTLYLPESTIITDSLSEQKYEIIRK